MFAVQAGILPKLCFRSSLPGQQILQAESLVVIVKPQDRSNGCTALNLASKAKKRKALNRGPSAVPLLLLLLLPLLLTLLIGILVQHAQAAMTWQTLLRIFSRPTVQAHVLCSSQILSGGAAAGKSGECHRRRQQGAKGCSFDETRLP